ncbi:MAG: hypothetical protein IJS91_01370 [Bacteroidales bacterium]|nr:hypothetical protein [Bacteroidales bacterium]
MSFWKKISEEKKAGLYTTLAFHLVALIVILLVTISKMADRESSFVLDFTKQEELEARQKEAAFKEQISRELDEQIGRPQEIRNASVDVGRALKDDRHKNPAEVYNEAEELQKRLDASRREAIQEAKNDDLVEVSKKEQPKGDTPAYVGPSVISWMLEGRTKYSLPVPAYQGYGAGDVYVSILVNRKGRVIGAKVNEAVSTPDSQLWEYALRAAKKSVFNADATAPEQQAGEIVYRFIKQ